MRAFLLSIVPTIVGMCTMLVLDSQLGNITQEQFLAVFQNKYLRAVTLFGAAYAANGQKVEYAVIAVLIYVFIVTTSFEGDDFERPQDPRAPAGSATGTSRPIRAYESTEPLPSVPGKAPVVAPSQTKTPPDVASTILHRSEPW